jgi:hypothetical protein
LEAFGNPADRPSLIHDQHSKIQPAPRREQGVSVRHEDLRFDDVSVVTHIVPEVFATSNVHNVPRNYT